MAPNKKIQITSKLDISSQHICQRVTDTSTGETKVIDKQEPHTFSKKTTITTNPVKHEVKGIEEPRVTDGRTLTINETNTPSTANYDTTQL